MNTYFKNVLFSITMVTLSLHADLRIDNYTSLDKNAFKNAFSDEYETCLKNPFFQKLVHILNESDETFSIVVMDQSLIEFIARAHNITDKNTQQRYYLDFKGVFMPKENVKKIFVDIARRLLANPNNANNKEVAYFLNKIIELNDMHVIALSSLTKSHAYTEVSQKAILQEVFHAVQHLRVPIYREEPYNYYASSEVEGELANLISGIKGPKPGQPDKQLSEIEKIPNIKLALDYFKTPNKSLTPGQIPLLNAALTAAWSHLKSTGFIYQNNIEAIKGQFNKTPVEKITYDKMKLLLSLRNQK